MNIKQTVYTEYTDVNLLKTIKCQRLSLYGKPGLKFSLTKEAGEANFILNPRGFFEMEFDEDSLLEGLFLVKDQELSKDFPLIIEEVGA